jgi:hypothetical protein
MAERRSGDVLLTYNRLLLDEQQTSYNIRSPPPQSPTTIDTLINQYSNKHRYKFMYVYVRIGMYSLRRCYTQLSDAQPKYAYKNKGL